MVVDKQTLKVVFWNANGVSSKIFVLYDFLSKIFIDICCISETHLKPDVRLHGRRLGGVLILVNKLIKHQLLPVIRTNLIENIAVEIFYRERRLQIISCYVPGGASHSDIRSHYSNDMKLLTRR